MKNFFLVEAPTSREESFLLLHKAKNLPDDQREFYLFSRFSKRMKRKNFKQNTQQVYAESVARFLDFVYEASRSSYVMNNEIEISDLIYAYGNFMLYGKDAEHPLANELADTLKKDRLTSPTSLAQPIDASIKFYLEVCLTFAESGYSDPLFGSLFYSKQEQRSSAEKAKIRENSWLAGMIKGSVKRAIPKRGKLFPGSHQQNTSTKSHPYRIKPLDIEHSVNLVRQKKSQMKRMFHRDMALYSLLLATGCRSHEALQLRLCDMEIQENGDADIFLNDPAHRTNPGLTQSEAKKLTWKGRQTPTTFLIYPFIDLFLEHLQKYFDTEYSSKVNHDFVFQKANGRPLFTARRDSLNTVFKEYLRNANIPVTRGLSRHSLRHTYGTYVLNYMPVPGNSMPGLPMHFVQIIMGHASILSTKKYAKHDDQILNSYILHANNHLRQTGERSVEKSRLQFHQRQVEKIEQIVNEIQEGDTQ